MTNLKESLNELRLVLGCEPTGEELIEFIELSKGSEAHKREVEISDLNKYPNLQVTHVGEENVYFTHNEKEYFYKA